MSRSLQRSLVVMLFLFATIAGGAGLLRAQPEKPATPDGPPRELPALGVIDMALLPRAGESPAAVILNEGFEGAWPAGLWTLQDAGNNDGGQYLWNDASCRPHSGSWGAFSTGGGANAMPCLGGYPNNVNTWAFWGPFDLSNATSAVATFYFYGSVENEPDCNFDRFLAVHVDDDGSIGGWQFCGVWTNGPENNGFYRRTLDLSGRLGDPTVWLGFGLQSDSSQTLMGIMIDDVSLDVGGGQTTCHPLTLQRSGQGAVPAASPSSSAGCANGRYTAGQTINLTADPANGWRVGSWQGTNNNGSTSVNNTVTMPNSAHTARVNYVQGGGGSSRAVMPFVLFGLTGFVGPLEIEPNNSTDQANGPLVLNRDYQGFPNDRDDYYRFQLNSAGQLRVVLTNITGRDPQLHLYYNTPGNRVGYAGGAPYQITYSGQPGTYWVRVYVDGNYNTTNLYNLRVNNP